uniref:non-specific serine/threonine protein kinase n=1 Tax=Gasterosteus aculeatus TaxID=69293 RepID=G3PMZ8_GASAC
SHSLMPPCSLRLWRLCPADGAPLSELSWSFSLAVVAVSLTGLFAFVFLMLACLCCKKRKTGFKEFRNVDGKDYHADMSTLASPASQSSPDVYILPLTEVSLTVAKQPAPSVQLLKSTDLSRHSLLYLKEIGNGWFGKVLLGEVSAGLSTTQVVVKELKAGGSVQDQMHFLEEARPFRGLQHPALLQCLAQCTEVTPYLLVMEFCPLGDVKGYLRSCRTSETMTPEPLILHRMACDIASGLLHMHKHNFTHSDLALRNCLMTADVSVKIGDYGLAQNKYKDDYYKTSDQTCVPLRWIAPELLDEVHGNLLVADQTPQSNMWSLGVTMWELFELGTQPYRHYSDRQVLTFAVREQQLRLPKPLLKGPLAERWFEVMQFCWLQPEQRPNAEEVHLLLSYLCAKGACEAEEDFERRWNSLRPNTVFNSHHCASAMSRDHPSSTSSSYPLLEHFSGADGYHSESGDDILTVTETSHGLNFEYKWEQARADQSESLGHGLSPSYYRSKHLHAPSILPVLSARSPSAGSEYYIRIEEPGDCNIDLDYTMCSYSPDYHADMYDSNDSSPAISLTMEPLLGQVLDNSPPRPWESSHYVSYKDRDGGYYYEHSPPLGMDRYLIGRDSSSVRHQESWGSRSLRQALGELENPLGISPAVNTAPQQAYSDAYMDTSQTSVIEHRHSSGGHTRRASHSCRQDAYVDFHYTMPSTDVEDSWPEERSPAFRSLPKAVDYLDHQAKDNSACLSLSKHRAMVPSDDCSAYVYLCREGGTPPGDCCHSHFVDPLTGLLAPGGPMVAKPFVIKADGSREQYVDLTTEESLFVEKRYDAIKDNPIVPKPSAPETEEVTPAATLTTPPPDDNIEDDDDATDDITDVTSGIFADECCELNASPALKSLQKHAGTPDSMDSMELPSAAGSCEGFSPASTHPKAVDSGYDTENNESPEFVPKEPHEPREQPPDAEPSSGGDLALGASQTAEDSLLPLSDKTPYRDSAYFSDYENDTVTAAGADSSSQLQLDAHLTEEPCDSASTAESGLDEWPSQESSSLGDWAAEVVGAMEEALGALKGDCTSNEEEEADNPAQETTERPNVDEVKTRPSRVAGEILHTAQHAASARRFSSSSPPPPASPPPPPSAADNGDGAGESDEELRIYSVQEQSGGEESDDECHPVPIVVSDRGGGHRLRSLLKMPHLPTTGSLEQQLESKKKTVSFFDDVTVYLFDQESPTEELAEHGFPLGAEGQSSRSKSQERLTASDDSSEESAGYEWEDDFPLLPLPTCSVASDSPPPRCALTAPDPQPAAQFSRFTVSPSKVSRFSITHISDSDMDSAGG